MSTSTNPNVKEFLSSDFPKYTQESLKSSKSASELAGTTISMVIESGNEKFSYEIKDGSTLSSKEGDMGKAMLRMKIKKEDLEQMIATSNLDMLLGMTNDLSKIKYNALSSLKGSFIAELSKPDGGITAIEVVLNGAESPKSIFKMSLADSAALMRKETNPVNLFMSGAMKVEGDMSFGMATQPLFT